MNSKRPCISKPTVCAWDAAKASVNVTVTLCSTVSRCDVLRIQLHGTNLNICRKKRLLQELAKSYWNKKFVHGTPSR